MRKKTSPLLYIFQFLVITAAVVLVGYPRLSRQQQKELKQKAYITYEKAKAFTYQCKEKAQELGEKGKTAWKESEKNYDIDARTDPRDDRVEYSSPMGTVYEHLSNSKFGCGSLETTDMTSLKDLGVHWKRCPLNISPSIARGEKTWAISRVDSNVETNQTYNIITYIIINPVPENGQWPTAKDFAGVVKEIAERYDGDGNGDMPGLTLPVYNYEICNEIFSHIWTGFTDEMYIEYLKECQKALREVNPKARLFCGAQVGSPVIGNNHTFHALIQKGGGKYFDAISYHEYHDMLMIDSTLSSFKKYKVDDKPIFITEADMQEEYQSQLYEYDEYEKANMTVRSFAYALAHDSVKVIIYTELTEMPQFKESLKWATLIDSQGKKKPSYYALKKLISKIDFFESGSVVKLGDEKVANKFTYDSVKKTWTKAVGKNKVCLKFVVNNKNIYMLWSERPAKITLKTNVKKIKITNAVPNKNGEFESRIRDVYNNLIMMEATERAVYVEEM